MSRLTLRTWFPPVVVTGLLVAVSALGATRLARHLSRRDSNEAIIPLEYFPVRPVTDDLRLGDLWENVSCERTVRIVNGGEDAVTIERFVSSCSCTDVKPSQL